MGKSSSKSAKPKHKKESSEKSPSASTSKSADEPHTSKSSSKTAKPLFKKPSFMKTRPATSPSASTSKSADEPHPSRSTAETSPTDHVTTSQRAGLVDLLPAVVIDNGSYSCKYGLAGESSPTGEVRTVVGRHQQDLDDSYVGNDALNKRSVLDLTFPIQRGLVQNWDDMETIWEYIFRRKLRIDPESRPVVLTEPALNPQENRERMVEIMFERFNVPAFIVLMQSLCAIYAAEVISGIVVDIGDGVTDIVPINSSVVVDDSIRRLELAGRDITEYMMKSPAARGEKITYEVGQTMKTSTCEVVADFDEVTRLQREGQEVHHLYATEALFTPSILGRNQSGIHATIMDSIMSCGGEQARANVGSNVVLAGGSTLFRGFDARLERELMQLAPPTMELNFLGRQDRESIIWSGASSFAALPVFKQRAISREEYLEVGPEIIRR